MWQQSRISKQWIMENEKVKHNKQPKEPVNEVFAMAPVVEAQSPVQQFAPPLTQPLTAGSGFSDSQEQEESEYAPETVVFEIGGFASPENPKDTGGKGIKIVIPPNLNAEQALVKIMMAMLRVSEAEAQIAIKKEGIHWENYNPEGHGTDREGNIIHLMRFKEKYAVRTAHEPESLQPKSDKGKRYYAGFQKYLAVRKDADSAELSDLFEAFAATVPELMQAKQEEADRISPKNQFVQSYSQLKAEILEFAIWDNLRAKREGIAAGIEGEKTALIPTIRAMADQFAGVPMDLLRQYVPARFYTKWAQLHVQAMLIEADLENEHPEPIEKAYADGLYQLAYHFAQYAEAKLGTTSSSGQRHYAKFDAKDVQTILRIQGAETLGPNEAQLLLYSHYKLSFALFEAFGKDISYQSESNILGPNGNKEDNLKGQQMQNAGATGKAVLDLTATRPNAQRINAKFLPEKVVSKFGKEDKSQTEGIELQLYAWHDAAENEWVLEDFSNVEAFKHNRVKGEAEGPIPTELFENLNSKLRFPKGALYYRVPNEASYRILRTTEPMEWADWLRYAAMAGIAVGLALSTAGASIPATVTMIAASGAFAVADGLDMAEKSSHGMLSKHDIALHSASILACVVSGAGATMRLGMMAENALAGIEGYSAAQISQIRMVAGLQLAADVPCFALFTADAFAQLKAASEQDEMTFDRVLGFLLQMGMQGVMLIGMHQSMLEAGGGGKHAPSAKLESDLPIIESSNLEEVLIAKGLPTEILKDISVSEQIKIVEIRNLLRKGEFDNAYRIVQQIETKVEPLLIRRIIREFHNEFIPFRNGASVEGLKSIEKTKRPVPESVIEKKYIDSHLKLFEEQGGAFIAVKSWVEGGGYQNFPVNKYVMLRSDLDSVLKMYQNSGKISVIEEAIGYSPGDLHGLEDEIYIFYLSKEKAQFHRTSGNERGANE